MGAEGPETVKEGQLLSKKEENDLLQLWEEKAHQIKLPRPATQ